MDKENPSPSGYLAKVSFCDLLHLEQHHGGDLLWVEGLGLSFVLHFYFGTRVIVDNCEGPVFHVGLHDAVVKTAPNKTLCI